jgi:hypothetical protein
MKKFECSESASFLATREGLQRATGERRLGKCFPDARQTISPSCDRATNSLLSRLDSGTRHEL